MRRTNACQTNDGASSIHYPCSEPWICCFRKGIEAENEDCQEYLEDYELDLKDGVMGRAVELKKCIRVGDVRKDVRDIAEFYFDLDNKTNFTTFSVLCSPLIAANVCLVVIHCLNKKTESKLFIEDDRQLLETLSSPAAMAIRNAKMAKEMVEKNLISLTRYESYIQILNDDNLKHR